MLDVGQLTVLVTLEPESYSMQLSSGGRSWQDAHVEMAENNWREDPNGEVYTRNDQSFGPEIAGALDRDLS